MASPFAGAQIIFMDAGQGDATLIALPDGQYILIDCGSKKNKNIVSLTIEEIFKNTIYKKKSLLALIITHPDGDQYTLIKQLIMDMKISIGHLYYGGAASQYTGLSGWLANPSPTTHHPIGPQHFSAAARAELSVGGMEVRIVAGNVGSGGSDSDPNLNSLVVAVSYKGLNFLLMGDSFKSTEEHIMVQDKANGGPLAKLLANGQTILKAGHHGSDSSTGGAWLTWCQPTAAFISSDTRSYGPAGTSTCVDIVINRILNLEKDKKPVVFDGSGKHDYVQYNTTSLRHEAIPTTRWFWTTLNKLVLTGAKDSAGKELFSSEGVSWYYTIDATGQSHVGAGISA
ncbi:MAG: hypothetical protein ABWX67_12010 [Allosphingosinicella sp.]